MSNVSLKVNAGEVLALVGENGAGKSTLMKILAGVHPPDEGQIFLSGQPVAIRNPRQAKELGIGIVFQELSLAENMTVAENIFALHEPMKFGLVDYATMNFEASALLDRLGFDVDHRAVVGSLSVSQQQLVEIAKVLRGQPRILILDEPTSALSDREVEQLYRAIDDLRSQGVGIVYISHKMEEIFRLTDRCSVLRDGVHVDDVATKSTSPDELVALMVGRQLEATFPPRVPVPAGAQTVLQLDALTLPGYYEAVSLEVKAGEILGIYGLVGAGRTELAQGIFGILPPTSGSIRLEGTATRIANPAVAVAEGLAYATEDRKGEGLVLTAPITHNTTMASIGQITRAFGFLDFAAERQVTDSAVDKFKVKTPSISQLIGNLSGGNQQKVVLAKWVETQPRVLILDEPTRGIDVGAKYEIYLLMQALSAQGVAIIMISSELPEILNTSHRVLVMNDHMVIAEVDPERTGAEEIMNHITGGAE
ncbi:MAG: sugar ABC transporter ATP-binding protein [Propioniciclava sp.]